jgi:hypothetical protein
VPRQTGISASQVTSGRAAAETVDASSLVPAAAGVGGLRAHVNDPVAAHAASAVSIEDAAGRFSADQVEGALQELVGGASGGRKSGFLSGGRFDEVIAGLPVAGLTLTLESADAGNNDTLLIVNGVEFNASGLQVTLSGVGTRYVYIDGDPTSGSYLTLRSSGSLPSVSASGFEHVLVARVVSSGTDVTAYSDARYFVRDLDRKVTLTTVSGETEDAWASGTFATLEAAINWINWYGSTEETRATLKVRGTHGVGSALSLGVDYLTIEGDGNALLTGSASTFFTVTSRNKITFKNLSFYLDAAGATAASVLNSAVILFENCSFTSAASGVNEFVDLDTVSSAYFVRCRFTLALASSGDAVRILDSTDVNLTECNFYGNGTGVAVSSDGSNFTVDRAVVTLFGTGVASQGTGTTVVVTNSTFEDVGIGLQVEDAATFVASGLSVSTSATTGTVAVVIDTVDHAFVSQSSFVSGRSNTTGLEGLVATSSFTHVSDCSFAGFVNSASPALTSVGLHFLSPALVTGCRLVGCGVYIEAASNVGLSNCTVDADSVALPALVAVAESNSVSISDCVLSGATAALVGVSVSNSQLVAVEANTITAVVDTGVHVYGVVNGFQVSANLMDGYVDAAPTATAILVNDNGTGDLPGEGQINNNTILRFSDGIILQGIGFASPIFGVTVSGNLILNYGHEQASRATTFDGRGSKGVGLDYASLITVVGNTFRRPGDVPDNGGGSLVWTQPVWPIGIYARNCKDVALKNNSMVEFQSSGSGTSVGILVECRDNAGAGPFAFNDVLIADNQMVFDDLNSSSDEENCGVRVDVQAGTGTGPLSLTRLTVSGGEIRGSVASAEPYVTYGVWIGAGERATLDEVSVEGLTVSRYGIAGVKVEAATSVTADTLISNLSIDGCSIETAVEPSATPSWMSGVMIVAERSAAANLTVDGVSVSRNSITSAIGSGIYVVAGEGSSFAGSSAIINVVLEANMIRGVADLSATPGVSVWFDSDDFGAEFYRIIVQNNVIADVSASSDAAVLFSLPESDMVSLQVVGNDLSSAVQVVAAASTAFVQNVSVVGNVIRAAGVADAPLVDLRLTGREVSAVRVASNDLFPGAFGTGIKVWHDAVESWSSLSDVKIADNSIVGDGASYGIFVSCDNEDVSDPVVQSLSIVGNAVSGLDSSGYGIDVSLESTTTLTAESVEVCRNICSGVADVAIRFRFSPEDGLSRLNGVAMDGNTIGASGSDLPNSGIHFIGPSFTSGTLPSMVISGISVSSNRVSHEVVTTGAAITAEFDCRAFTLLGSVYTVEGLRINGNLCNSTGIGTDSRILDVNATCNVEGLDVSGNTLWGGGTFDHGLVIRHQYSTSDASQCANTTDSWVAGQAGAGGALVLDVNGSGDTAYWPVTWEAVSINANTIRNVSCPGVFPAAAGRQQAALCFRHVRYTGANEFIGVAVYGLSLSNHVVNGAGSSSGQENVGLVINVLGIDAGWPGAGGGTVNDNAGPLQEGWSIMGNVVTHFRVYDTSATTNYGQCVRIFATPPALSANNAEGVLIGNVSADGSSLNGWDDLALTTVANNANLTARTTL